MGRKLNSDLVYQRIIDLKHGDCMKCCITTLFDLDYDEVPNFVDDLLWHESYREFISKCGYKLLPEVLSNNKFFTSLLHAKDLSMSNTKYINELKNTHWIISRDSLKKAKGVDIEGHKIMPAVVLSPNYFDINKPVNNQVLHQVLIDEDCDIVFDPNPEYQNINQYPLADLIGFNGVISIEQLKRS